MYPCNINVKSSYLTMILNARATPPKAIKASFSPLLGIYLAIEGIPSSFKNVRIGVSQNSGPVGLLSGVRLLV